VFNVGDLVVFKASGIVRSRYNPLKKFGIVTEVKRSVYRSYDGTKEDRVTVLWQPWNEKEVLMEFYLEHLERE
jgi:hypothetical protein